MHLKEGNKHSISVIVPVYNVENYLSRCIDSILNQTMTPNEIILVDDGSPDKCPEICDEYAQKYPHITVIHKSNGGLSSARKAGWEQAKGDLITFVDSDDYLHKDYLKNLSTPFFLDENVDLSLCGYSTDNQSNITHFTLPHNSNRIANADIASDYIIPLIGTIPNHPINIPGFVWIRMYKRDNLLKSDFVSEREYFTEDILMNILYAKRMSGDIAIVNHPLYYYCINPGSLTLKYRDGIFSMLMARYNYCQALVHDLKVDMAEMQKRLNGNLVSAVTRSVYNIGRIRKYKVFRTELKKIYKQPEIIQLFDNNDWPLNGMWSKIIYYSYKHKSDFLLYKLLKLRKTL